jgi:hypothetical protein
LFVYIYILFVVYMLSALPALANAVSRIAKTTKKLTSKKKKLTPSKRKRQAFQSVSAAMARNITSSSDISAPAAAGKILSRNIRQNVVTRVPIHQAALYVCYSVASSELFFTSNGVANAGQTYFDISPYYTIYNASPSASYLGAFGTGMAKIASGFAQWRLSKPLKCIYVSALPTSTNGIITLGWSRDAGINQGGTVTDAAVSAMIPSASFPIWCPPSSAATLTIPAAGPEDWKYVFQSETTYADDRISGYGAICGAQIGFNNGSSLVLGKIYMNGEIEFRGVEDLTVFSQPANLAFRKARELAALSKQLTDLGIALPTPPPTSSSSSSSSASIVTESHFDCHDIEEIPPMCKTCKHIAL